VSDFSARVKDDNPDPRVACALLLDTSASMSGAPMTELNAGFATFCNQIKDDPLAKKRTEVVVITFGGVARVEIPFTEGRDLQPRNFVAGGGTPMGAALDLAMSELAAQKQAYKAAGLEYYRPWIFLISDGSPTDADLFIQAASNLRTLEAAKSVTVFSVAVAGADKTYLSQLSTGRPPLDLKGLSFQELFSWLSASMAVVSNSSTFGASGSGDAQQEAMEQNPLPSPAGWATW
jgi:uncharacterized protein YegL